MKEDRCLSRFHKQYIKNNAEVNSETTFVSIPYVLSTINKLKIKSLCRKSFNLFQFY